MVREEVLQTIRRVAGDQGGTVFISSHDMEEVERLAEWVGFLDDGVLTTADRLVTLMARHRRLEVLLPPGAVVPSELPKAWVLRSHSGVRLTFVDTAFDEANTGSLLARILGPQVHWSSQAVSLSEVFRILSQAGRGRRDRS